MSKARNSSIELLRIIPIMGVVILHYNNEAFGGAFKYVEEGSINQIYLFLSENVFICAVNVFITISAYFLCKTGKRSFVKVIALILQVIIFQLVSYFIVAIKSDIVSIGGILTSLLPLNYFIILYSVLYIISPYFNMVIDRLSAAQLKKLVIILFLIFSVWTIGIDYVQNIFGLNLGGINPIGIGGSQSGYTIINFTLMYFIGAYIRINDININKSSIVVGMTSIVIIMTVLSLCEHKFIGGSVTTWYYNNPFNVLLAALTVKLFSQISFSSKIINELAKAAFTCFLFHSLFISKFHIDKAVQGDLLNLIAHQLLVSVSLYLVSYIIYKIYSLCTGWFIRLITPLCDKVNISLEMSR